MITVDRRLYLTPDGELTEDVEEAERLWQPEGAEISREQAEAVGYEAKTESDPPSQADLKADWIDYAVEQGMDPDEAEDLTKAELIEQFGG